MNENLFNVKIIVVNFIT